MLIECPAFETFETGPWTWHDRRRSSGDMSDASCSSLSIASSPLPLVSYDGSIERPEKPSAGTRRASASLVDQPTPTERALAPPLGSQRPRGSTVADRIKAFNGAGKTFGTAPLKNQRDAATTTAPKRQSTNMAKRMNPFIRRDADAHPLPSPSPMSQSKEPLKPMTIHNPIPQRQAAVLLRDRVPTTNPLSSASFSKNEAVAESAVGQEILGEKGKAPAQTPSSLDISPLSCKRHGRDLKPRRRSEATVTGMERSLSGAYIPSGLRIRHQVDPTSPYYFLAQTLTKTEGTSVSPEPCSDCLAEERIRRREDEANVGQLAQVDRKDNASPPEISSTATEPGTPVQELNTGPTLVGSSADHQAVMLPGSSVPPAIDAGLSSIVAADLGDMIDAIIIEHRGTLNRVITNLRNGNPDAARMQSLSRELSLISCELAGFRSPDADTTGKDNERYSVILDTPPEFLRSRTKSVPDLVDYIDSAAADLSVKLPKKGQREPEIFPERSTYSPPSADDRPLDQMAMTLRDRAANKSVVPKGSNPRTLGFLDPSAESVGSEAMRADSPLLIAVNVPSAMPKAMPVPMIGPTSSMIQDFTSPAGPGSSGNKQATADATSSAAPSGAPATILPMSANAMPSPSSDGASEVRLPISKIPEPQTPTPVPSASRKHMSVPPRLTTAPWSKPNTGSRRNPFQALKPSELKELQKQQGTFTQPFVKDLARDASSRERSERRSRMGAVTPGPVPT